MRMKNFTLFKRMVFNLHFALDFGFIRLTVEGTRFYQNLDNNDKENFIKQMGIEISKSIPVDNSRLTYLNKFFEYDESNRSDLLFLTFRISPPDENHFNKKDAKDVFNDFEKLLSINDFTTSLDIYNNTKYIDKRY